MKVYVVMARDYDETWVEAIFTTREAAMKHVDDTLRKEYDRAADLHRRQAAYADRWVAAGGGLTEPLEALPTYDKWKPANNRFQVNEERLRE